jgi:hypothetical protein
MRIVCVSVTALLVGLAILLIAMPNQAAGEVPYQVSNEDHDDWVWQVEHSLRRSALHSPKGSAFLDEIQRTIHDIGYYLQRAREARHLADPRMAEIHATQAINLLQRGVRKGYFRQQDIDPFINSISQYLPGVQV